MNSVAARKWAELRFQVLLRIKHPTLDTADITTALRIEPEHTANAGQTLSATGHQRLHSESYWVATLQLSSVSEWFEKSFKGPFAERERPAKAKLQGLFQVTGPYDFHLLACLRKLETHHEFLKRITATQGSVTLVLQREGRDAPLTITPYLAQRLADLGVRLEID